MKILLINPPHPLPRDPYYFYPMGIASIMAVLEENEYSPKFLDFYYALDEEDGWQKISKNLSLEKPDIIGIPVFTENRITALKIASLCKELFPKAIIVLGGPHPTAMYAQLLQNYNIDAVVIGEGEVTFIEIVRAVEHKKSFETINGIAFNKSNGKIQLPPPPRINSQHRLTPNACISTFQSSKRSYCNFRYAGCFQPWVSI